MMQRYPGRQQGEAFQEVLCAEAADVRTAAARLQELAKSGGAIAIEVARNPSVSREAMLALAASGDPLVQCALVQNQRVTKDVLLDILKMNPPRFVKRAIAKYSHQREVINFLEKTAPNVAIRRALAANRGVTYETMQRAYRRWPSIATSARQEWITLFSQDEEVREQCLWRVSTSIDPWLTTTFGNIAFAPATSPELLRLLSTLGLKNITQSLSMNPSTPKDILEVWANDATFEFPWALAANPSMPPEVLSSMSSKISYNLKPALAANPSTPPALLSSYATSRDIYVLTSLARNPGTPPETLEALARRRAPDLSWPLSSNPSLPPAALLALAAKSVAPFVKAILEKHPNMTEEVRYLLRYNEESALIAAKDPETPPRTLLLFAQDERFIGTPVFLALLSHPNTPAEVLERVIQQRRISSNERLCIARNPKATAEMLGILATLPGKNLRALIAKHPNTSRETLEILAESKVDEIREAAKGRSSSQ